MSDSQKPAPPAPANQTIQLDALDPAEAEAIAAGASSRPSEAPSRRKTPPPLPPSAMVSNPPPPDLALPMAPSTVGASHATSMAPAPRAVSIVPAPPRPMGQKIGLGAMFVVLVAGAVYLGLQVGTRARGPSASPSVSVSTVPSPAASDQVLELPTIEMAAPQGSK